MSTSVISRAASVERARSTQASILSTLVMARLTFHEAARRKILWAALILGLAFLVLYGIGLHTLIEKNLRIFLQTNRLIRNQVLSVPLMMGLYAVNYLTVLMAVFTSVDTLAGEIASGTIQSIATKPIRRWEIVLGKWMGFIGMLSLYIILMAGGVITETYFLADYVPPRVLWGVSLIWMESLLLLSVTFLWGTSFSTLTTGVLTLGLQGLAFIGGWIEQFGALMHSQSAVNVGIVASLIMPSEALWRRAIHEMQSPRISVLGVTPFSSVSVPSTAMVIYAGLYLMVALSLAIRRFGRRDL